MLDSVGIRLPKYKVRELALGMKENGDITTADVIEKMTFIQVTKATSKLHWYMYMDDMMCRLTGVLSYGSSFHNLT